MGDGAQVENELKKKKSQKAKKTEKIWFSDSEFKTRHNLPDVLPKRPTDIYLISPDLIAEQYLRALRLLKEEAVWLHSLGSNIPVAITFLNKLKSELSADQLEVETWSQTWEGFTDSWELQSQAGGFTSGLHIKIIYKGSK